MELCKNGNVIPLAGNVDAWRLRSKESVRKASVVFGDLLSLRAGYGASFFDELTGELGYKAERPEGIGRLKEAVIAHFERELGSLSGLPTVLETQRFLFVHGGFGIETWATMKKGAFRPGEIRPLYGYGALL